MSVSSFFLRISKKLNTRKLHIQGTYFKQLFDHSTEGIVIVDVEEKIIDTNKSFNQMFDYLPEESRGKNINDLIVPQEYNAIKMAANRRPVELGKTCRQKKDGTKVHVSVLGVPIIVKNKLIGSYWIYRDITNQVLIERDRRKKEALFQLLAENIQDLICLHRIDGSFEYLSPSVKKLLGYGMNDLMIMDPYELIQPDDRAIVRKTYDEAVSRKSSTNVIYRIKKKDGNYIWIESHIQPVTNSQNEVMSMVTSSRDITQTILAEEKLKTSLEVKEMLLSEIHHRVKNNLTIAGSLLSLQVEKINDRQLQEIIYNTISRIQAMANIHEQLYQSGNFENVEIKNYIRKLITELLQSSGREGITYSIESDNIQIDLESAIPIGLILNELIINSLKHAFIKKEHGLIEIKLERLDKKKVLLTYKDDGIGFPVISDEKDDKRIGLYLITGLVKQLNGKCEIPSYGESTYKITFKSS